MSLNCRECREPVTVTLRKLLQQGESGDDYEDGSEGASIECPACEYRMYVPSLCAGTPSGKFFKHCTRCDGFGQCLGDYRYAHCSKCGKHYYQGLMGNPCDCERQKEGLRQIMGILGYGGAVGKQFVDAFGDELLDEGESEGCGECDGCLDGGPCEASDEEDEEAIEKQQRSFEPRAAAMRAHLENIVLQESLKKAMKGNKRGVGGGGGMLRDVMDDVPSHAPA